jgi:hypothetical protein
VEGKREGKQVMFDRGIAVPTHGQRTSSFTESDMGAKRGEQIYDAVVAK